MDSQPPLPYRVLGSARGLACSTFSGVAGIEAELRDPRSSGKQTGITRVRSKPGSPEADLRRRQRKRSLAGGSSKGFRSAPKANLVRSAEEGFLEFQVGASSSGLGVHSPPDVTAGRVRSEWDYYDVQEGPCAYQDAASRLDSEARAREPQADSMHVSELEGFSDKASQSAGLVSHSIAARRLDQIESHLLRYSNLETSAMDQTQYTTGRMDSMLYSQSQHQQQQQQHLNHHTAQQHIAANHRVANVHDTPHHHTPPHQPTAHPTQSTNTEDQEPEPRLFRCPYFDCHNRLQQIQNSHSGSTSKPCVHTGCNFLADSASAWVDHVVSPHHDLQGAPVVGDDMEDVWEMKGESERCDAGVAGDGDGEGLDCDSV